MMTGSDSTKTSAGSPERFIEFPFVSDTRMDQKGAYFNGDPLNRLPARCATCGFPDLDHVPQPYYILRGPSMTPAEVEGSNYGYLLVRDRFKAIVECLLPNQCKIFPTTYLKTAEVTSWWLMMPTSFCRTGNVKSSVPRCSSCGEPAGFHGSEYEDKNYGAVRWPEVLSMDIYKTENWFSAEAQWGGFKSWVHRDTVVSLRFVHLLRELKLAGSFGLSPHWKLDSEEAAWVGEQIQRLKEAGIRLTPEGVSNADAQKWFRSFPKVNAGNGVDLQSVKELERTHRFKFPKSYLDFIKKVGRTQFSYVDSEEGLNAEVLPPDDCDLTRFRLGQWDFEDEESRKVDGIMFAVTDSGDCFCFDFRKDRKEYEVFVYRHEYDMFESYAENFIECLRRFNSGEEES